MMKIVNNLKDYKTKEDFLEKIQLSMIIIINASSTNTKSYEQRQLVKKDNRLFVSMRKRYKIFKERDKNKDQKDQEDQKDNQKK